MLGLAGLLVVLAVAASAVSLVASVWLVVVAFKRGVGWGLAVLFVPFAAIVFAIRYWQEARRPFLIGLGTAVAASLFFVGTAGIGAAAMSKRVAARMSGEPAKAAPLTPTEPFAIAKVPGRPMQLTAVDPVVPSGAPAAPVPAIAPVPKAESFPFDGADITSDGYAEISFLDAKRAVGRTVRLFARDGRVHEGDLVGATAGSVEIEHGFRSGTISVEFRKAEVEKLLVKVIS